MQEDSISCSPGNDKRSRSRRFHRSIKRRSQRLTGAAPANNTLAQDMPCLEALYEGSIHSTATEIQYDYFNPFENGLILAAADRAEKSAASSNLKNFISQGFVKLEELAAIDSNKDNFFPPILPPQCSTIVSTPLAQRLLGPETQFGITESEFVRFCDEVEIDVGQKSTSDAITPKVKKSIVDAILEDFCGSPYSESPPKFVPDDDMPIFRFKSESLRTYSRLRCRKRRRNIVTELASVASPKDDGNNSDSSGLSVQEDLSQSVVPQLDTVDLNNSIRVRENLLNLSSYYSQITSNEKSPPLNGEEKECPLSTIVDDIMEIRRRKFIMTRSKSAEEFHGFSDGDSDTQENNLKELLEDEDDVLQQINCDSLCNEKVSPKVSFVDYYSDIESTLENANAVIEEANKLISSRAEWQTRSEDSTNRVKLNCEKHEKEEQIFDDNDLWNDTECLQNYKSQEHLTIYNKPAVNERFHLLVDHTSLNIVSKNPEELLKELENHEQEKSIGQKYSNHQTNEIKQMPSVLKNVEQDEETFDAASTSKELEVDRARKHSLEASFKKPISVVSTFTGFSTASRKPIAISDTAKRRADEILSKFEQAEYEQRMETVVDVTKTSSGISKEYWKNNLDQISTTKQLSREAAENCCKLLPSFATIPTYKSSASMFLGFSTASNKPVTISDDAKRKAKEILKNFEQDERDKNMAEENNMASEEVQGTNASTSLKTIKIANDMPYERVPLANKNAADSSSSPFAGFSTASRKPIGISDEAKRKADELLKKFEQAETEEKLQEANDLVNAKRKPVEVSEEVEQKAQELLMDIEFFEEAFEEELKTMDSNAISETDGVQSLRYAGTTKCQMVGFKTASKKPIQVSEAAKRHADQLMRKVDNEGLPQDFLKCIEADLNDVFIGNSGKQVERADGAFKSPGKVHVHGHEVNSLENIDQSIEDPSVINEVLTENLKRKGIAFQIENLCKTPVPISSRRLSCNERTPLNRIENAIIRKTSSMPLVKSTPRSTLISRKNLLSLSKRKKLSLPDRGNEGSIRSKTPESEQHPSNANATPNPKEFFGSVSTSTPRLNANATPNLKEFFGSVATSTPRLIRNGTSKVFILESKDSSIDTDFRQINWEDANNSASQRKISYIADSNVSYTEVNPSPKQRIERLKMYGEPPPISPILMVNKCRPSGLRRGRSLLKP